MKPFKIKSVLSAFILSLTVLLMASKTSLANEAALSLELNRFETVQDTCRASFVLHNTLKSDVPDLAFELVLFNAKGLVEKMTILGFGAVPKNKTLVRRFDLKGVQCSDISRILVNGIARCGGNGISAEACANALILSNRTKIVFGK